MKGKEVGLVEFLRQPMQMVASGSRGYHWTKEQCQKLSEDIVHAGKDKRVSSHSIGAIIYIEHGILSTTSIPRNLLVDGQQRLATLSLLLLALEASYDWRKDSTGREIHDCLLSNPQGKGALRHRLVLFGDDQDVFLNIIRGNPPPAGTALADNFAFLKSLIEKSAIDPGIVYRGMSKLTFVPISTDQYYENARFIHENIEETGLDDNQKKLVQNWLGLISRS